MWGKVWGSMGGGVQRWMSGAMDGAHWICHGTEQWLPMQRNTFRGLER